MPLPVWQECVADSLDIDVIPPAQIPFFDAKKFFAVDSSGSTSGGIMQAQAKAVVSIHGNSEDTVTKWDHQCEMPQILDNVPVNYFAGLGGTSPDMILRHPTAIRSIRESDLWVLITDGQIAERNVTELTRLADVVEIIHVPVVLLIVGGRYLSPSNTNISVGITFFAVAREALILFKDYSTGHLYPIGAKGGFAALMEGSIDLSSWDSLPKYANEAALVKRCGELSINLTQCEGRKSFTRAASLGPEWDIATNALADVPTLLIQQQIRLQDLRNLLQEEAITQLALICKTRGQLSALRDLLFRHKQHEVIVRLEDRHGAGKIIEKLRNVSGQEDKLLLMEQLRDAHAANRATYLELQNSPSEESRLATENNRLINRGLAIISGFEKSSYTADILSRKSNRAMRSVVLSVEDAEMHLQALDLSDDTEGLRGTCPICCGEEQIMSVALRRLDTVEENTTDFALNLPLRNTCIFPLCSKTETLLTTLAVIGRWASKAERKYDIQSMHMFPVRSPSLPKVHLQEDIVATIPTVCYQGSNKKYINHQLTLAITAGIATSTSGILQLFMTIIERTLETKNWCAKDIEDVEICSRRQVLDWTLRNLLQRCESRENFGETGKWVAYPQALLWAVSDYNQAYLDSWIIQYPLAGFNQLVIWYGLLDLPIAPEKMEAMQKAKLINLVVTNIMNGLLHEKDGDKLWTHPFLQLVYKGFNAQIVPQDLGPASIVPADRFWPKLEDSLGQWQDVKRFLSGFNNASRRDVTRRIQAITFWALFTQKGHTTPKTFFANVKSREPLAPAVLDPEGVLAEGPIIDELNSVFCPTPQAEGEPHETKIPPFVSPFGPSVLHCGYPGCLAKFYKEADLQSEPVNADAIRGRRADHLSEIYGIGNTFNSQTGLPEPTQAPKAPTSYHNTLHISTARTWSQLDLKRKQALIDGIAGRGNKAAIATFVRDVQLEICARNHRGNIYSASIEDEIRGILPSFLKALQVASKKTGLEDMTGCRIIMIGSVTILFWQRSIMSFHCDQFSFLALMFDRFSATIDAAFRAGVFVVAS